MERKIGEVFEYEGKKLQVKESASSGCDGCFFDEQHIPCSKYVAGYCDKFRADKKKVIFVEATEQNQTEQPQKLNLCEILKDCPIGTKFYSPVWGKVSFERILDMEVYTIEIDTASGYQHLTKEGYYIKSDDAECILFPSKEQRDWSKFTAPWLKKERFDPKTLKPFDKIIFKGHGMWFCGLFSHIHNSYACIGETYHKCVIPYNDDTKHLVGTRDEAPEFYKYWED